MNFTSFHTIIYATECQCQENHDKEVQDLPPDDMPAIE